MIKVSKYILFQAFGWGSFALFNIYFAYMNQELTYRIFYINLLLSVFGFLISHGYRYFILAKKWIQKPTETLIRYVLFATAVLSVVYNLLYYLLLFLLRIEVMAPDAYLVSLITVYVIFALWNLIYFTWQYLEKSRLIQIETLKMESALKDLEIKTIRSNLQPHFIFNSLNSIRALIDEDPELARAAITKISNILRNTITKQEATDTLQNELALVEDYLDLEKIRFEERLHFVKNIDETTLGVQIPTMMLQTLIENAIKHGISNLEAGGTVRLNTKTAGQDLIIEVINDINAGQMGQRENSLGFGLSSSKQRLKLLYEDEASLSLNFDQDQAMVLIRIPLNKKINSTNP